MSEVEEQADLEPEGLCPLVRNPPRPLRNQRWDNGQALDVACGSGQLTKALSERIAHVIGIDRSEAQLQKALQGNVGRLRIYLRIHV